VSWSKAIRTGVWYVGDHRRPSAEPVFDFEEIRTLAAEADAHNDAWRNWFERERIEPLAITYEELSAAKVELTRRVLEFLGVPSDGVSIREQTSRQRDAVNADWVRRFRLAAAARR
jgi:LPS sulfotransferase NodH